MKKRALLLLGSPKHSNSTSESLGNYLLERIGNRGLDTEKLNIGSQLSDTGTEELVTAVNRADLLILSAPLYIDSAPAAVTRAMEIVAESRQGKKHLKQQSLLVICNCGFPEAHQNQTAVDIYKCFAKEAGFNWLGGLSLGGGGAINGQPLPKLGGMVKNVIKSLDLTASALGSEKGIPEEAFKLMQKPMFPNWLYMLIGQLGWRIQARKHGTHKNLNDRPYQT